LTGLAEFTSYLKVERAKRCGPEVGFRRLGTVNGGWIQTNLILVASGKLVIDADFSVLISKDLQGYFLIACQLLQITVEA
jgi:hypothetical protein